MSVVAFSALTVELCNAESVNGIGHIRHLGHQGSVAFSTRLLMHSRVLYILISVFISQKDSACTYNSSTRNGLVVFDSGRNGCPQKNAGNFLGFWMYWMY